MSWTASATVTPDGDVFDAFADQKPQGQDIPEAQAAYDAALGVVDDLLFEGVLGNREKSYVVRLNGHANPDNEPVDGWANDTLNISISQL